MSVVYLLGFVAVVRSVVDIIMPGVAAGGVCVLDCIIVEGAFCTVASASKLKNKSGKEIVIVHKRKRTRRAFAKETTLSLVPG
jgi:hypothetical protein